MAFGGTIVVTSLGERMARITGATLAASTAGVIQKAGVDVVLPSDFPAISSSAVVIVNKAGGVHVSGTTVSVVNAAGTITVTNLDAGNATGELDIIVMEPHSIIA